MHGTTDTRNGNEGVGFCIVSEEKSKKYAHRFRNNIVWEKMPDRATKKITPLRWILLILYESNLWNGIALGDYSKHTENKKFVSFPKRTFWLSYHVLYLVKTPELFNNRKIKFSKSSSLWHFDECENVTNFNQSFLFIFCFCIFCILCKSLPGWLLSLNFPCMQLSNRKSYSTWCSVHLGCPTDSMEWFFHYLWLLWCFSRMTMGSEKQQLFERIEYRIIYPRLFTTE